MHYALKTFMERFQDAYWSFDWTQYTKSSPYSIEEEDWSSTLWRRTGH